MRLKTKIPDSGKLVLAAIGVIVVLLSLFAFADLLHLNPKWISMLATTVAFFAAIGWDYRKQFRSPSFVLFFVAWVSIHLVIFVTVLGSMGWVYWFAALFVELFLFYATLHWCFKLEPPPHGRSNRTGHDDAN
jgi:hypothetical protein